MYRVCVPGVWCAGYGHERFVEVILGYPPAFCVAALYCV